MQHGNLSNQVSPRVLIVFENALGFCTDHAKFVKAKQRGHWATAMTYWERNDLAFRRIEYLNHHKDINFEVVTFISDFFADQLVEWFDYHDLPIHRVWYSTPENLGRRISYMVDVAFVYDPEPTRWLMYGSKGRFLESVSQIGEGM